MIYHFQVKSSPVENGFIVTRFWHIGAGLLLRFVDYLNEFYHFIQVWVLNSLPWSHYCRNFSLGICDQISWNSDVHACFTRFTDRLSRSWRLFLNLECIINLINKQSLTYLLTIYFLYIKSSTNLITPLFPQ